MIESTLFFFDSTIFLGADDNVTETFIKRAFYRDGQYLTFLNDKYRSPKQKYTCIVDDYF